MVRRDVPAGEAVVRQGDPGDTLYVLEAGEAEVQVTDALGRSRVVRRLRPGDHFGEIALLGAGTRTADVVARTPLRLLGLSKERYEAYLSALPEVGRALHRTAAERLSSDKRA